MDNLFFDLSLLKHLGKGAIVGKTVRIRRPEFVVIGRNSIIDDFTYISCALEIGRFCHIAANVTISGGRGCVRIGDFASIAAGCSLHACSSDYRKASFELPSIPEEFRKGGICEDITLGDHVLLGAHSVVLPGVRLPEGFASAAHTVIRKKPYEAWTLYGGGYECKKVCHREHDLARTQAASLLAAIERNPC